MLLPHPHQPGTPQKLTAIVLAIIGTVLMAVCSRMSTDLNSGVQLGIWIISAGIILYLYGIYLWCDEERDELPTGVDFIFPNYPRVTDYDGRSRRLSGFRQAVADFFAAEGIPENAPLQNHATQLLWHSLYLQKRRLDRMGLRMTLQTQRRAYSRESDARSAKADPPKVSSIQCIRSKEQFDGKYDVSEVYEEIRARRQYHRGSRRLLSRRDRQVARYAILSARQKGKGQVICPSCGNATTRSNLLDGCDYCGTRFTVEDLGNRVGAFGFRQDFETYCSKFEAMRDLVVPWLTMLSVIPPAVFGSVGCLVYITQDAEFMAETLNVALLPLAVVFTAALLGLAGWVFTKMALYIIVPIMYLFSELHIIRRRMLYSSLEEAKQSDAVTAKVRKSDPLFSLQHFLGGVQNKLAAIHYADSFTEINAFSLCDLTPWLRQYAGIADLDTLSITLDDYQVRAGVQEAYVSAQLELLRYDGRRLRRSPEKVKLVLLKRESCKTQAVCGPAVFRCRGCGASLSLVDGKHCSYCGTDLQLIDHDWVIAEYRAAGR